jgi:hypothetical protein
MRLSGSYFPDEVTDQHATLRLPIPIPSKYPTPYGFPMWVYQKQEKPPRLRGLPCRCRQLATPRFARREICKWTKSVLA